MPPLQSIGNNAPLAPSTNQLDNFDYSANEHSFTNAYLLGLLNLQIQQHNLNAPNATTDFQKATAKLSKEGDYDITYLVAENIGVAILCHSKGTICVFRGVHYSIADEWTQIANDKFGAQMCVPHSSWGTVSVHQRLYRAVNRVYKNAHQIIQSQNNYGMEPKPLFITGHGRGASMATIFAYRLKRIDTIQAQGIYLFGAPRCGDLIRFQPMYRSEDLWEQTFRWVNKSDYANQVPHFDLGIPIDLSNPYAHVGRLNLIDEANNVFIDHEETEYEPGITDASLAEHQIESYVHQMYNLLHPSGDEVVGETPTSSLVTDA